MLLPVSWQNYSIATCSGTGGYEGRALGAAMPGTVYVGGIAARSERYMKTHWEHAKGFLDAAGLAASRATEEQAFLAAQREAGVGPLSPAYVAWEDLLRPLCAAQGAAAGALTRFFETNTFYRQPELSGALAPADVEAWSAGWSPPPGEWVLSLPSPWDAAVRSLDLKSRPPAVLAQEVGHHLRPVVDWAVRSGASLVRFQDPSIVYPRATARDAAALAEGLAAAAGPHAARCTLHLTNGDPFAHPEVLQANPLGGLSIEDPGRAPPAGLRLANGTRLSCAVVRGEESLAESAADIASRAAVLGQRLGLGVWGITNGWDLDHVPHAIAARKLSALGQAARLLEVTA